MEAGAGYSVCEHTELHGIFRREWTRRPSRGNTCLDKVFSLKNISNFTHDDVIFSPSKPIKMNVLDDHLDVTRGRRLLSTRQGKRPGIEAKDKCLKLVSKTSFFNLMIHAS